MRLSDSASQPLSEALLAMIQRRYPRSLLFDRSCPLASRERETISSPGGQRLVKIE
jgi:hypothetical protein